MKAIKHLSVIASVLMLASCAKEEILPEVNEIHSSGRTTVTFVSSTDTKTYLDVDHKTTHWGEDENVLLWEGENPLEISSKSFEGGILTLTADVEDPQSLFYSVIGPEGEGNATRTSVKVLATQHPAQASFDPNAEILVAQPATCSTENTVALRYNRPVAITIATLKNLEAGEKVLTVKITADQNLTGSVNFTYEGTNVKAAMEGEGKTITCTYTADNTVKSSGEFPVYFISLNAEVKEFEFEVSTDQHKYYKKVVRPDDSPIVLNDNRVASFGFKLDNADKADAEGDKFVKVTAAPTDWSGEYLLVYEDNTTAYCWTGVDAADCNTTATIADGAIASQPDGAVTITIASMEGGYSVLVNGGTNNGKYIAGTSGSNQINFGTTASANTLSYDSEYNSVLMTSNTSVMRYNSASDNNRFRYFKSSSYTNQKAVQLYKKTLGGYGLFTLHTPTNIQYDSENNKITWDAVENAGRYTISLNGGEPIECEINEYSTSELTAEYYYASVIALPSAEKEDTYKASEAGSHEGWFKIDEPKMPKLDANNITLNITKSTITASWENDPSSQNGYIAEIWSRTKTDKDEDVDDELLKTEDVTEGTVTFTELTAGTKYHIKVTTKAADITDDRGTRAYINSDPANKYPQTSSVYTIAEILALSENTVTCQVENAVIYAKGENCYLVNDGTGYIMVNASAGDYNVGDKLTISGKTQLSYGQKRFDDTTTIIEKTGTVTPEHPTVASFDGEFTYAKYVNIVGKMTSSSGWLVTDASGNIKLKVLTNEQTGANKYVSVTGYLTHDTGSYKYLIATEIVEHSLTVSPEELTWEATETTQKSAVITLDNGSDWTYTPTSDDDWTISKNNGSLEVSPKSQNSSPIDKVLAITITHATNATLTKTITFTQIGKEATYAKVTSINDLSVGDQIVITSSDGKFVMGEQGNNNVPAVSTNPVAGDDYSIKLPSTVMKLTLEAGTTTGTYAFAWNNGGTTNYLYAASPSSNYLKSQTTKDANGSWTITIDNGTASIVAQGTNSRKVMQYNSSSTLFSCYGSATQTAVAIYAIDNTTHRNLQFSSTSDTKDIKDGKNVNALSLTGITDGVTYSSTNTAVATIDGNSGAITLVSAGETTIKATAPKTATLKGDEVNYTLTVVDTRVKEKLAPPTGLSSGTPTSSGTTLSWSAVSNAGSYKVEYKASTADSWTSTTVNSTSCELTGLTASTTYSWRVTAIPSDTETYNNSDPANGTDFTTAAGQSGGELKTYHHTFSSKPSTGNNISLSNISWNIEAENLNNYNSDYAGVQFGTSSKAGSITLTSSSAWSYQSATNVKEIRVWINTGGGTVTPTVSVGGTNIASDGTTITKQGNIGNDYQKANKVTFKPSSSLSGVVIIKLEKKVAKEAAGYICAIEIDAD